MPVFSCFYKIIRNNKVAILIYIVLFVALLFFHTGNSTSNTGVDYADTSVPIAVIDRDNTQLSHALTEYLGEHNELVDLADNKEALQDALFFRSVEYILFISAGFENDLLEGTEKSPLENVKLPNSTAGIYIDNRVDRYISTLTAYLNAGYEAVDAIAHTDADLKIETSVQMSDAETNGQTKPAIYFQILGYIMISLIVSAMGPILIAFNQTDIVKRTESSSMKLRDYNAQIALGCVVSSVAIWIVLIGVSFLLYGNDMLNLTSGLRVLNSFAFMTICVSIAFLLGKLAKKTNTLASINNVISLGMSFLCGVYVPQDLLGSGVLSVSKFLPAYWYIRNNNILSDMSTSGLQVSNRYYEGLAIQIGFAAAFFVVALVISRQKKVNSII